MGFVTVTDGKFSLDGTPYYFLGTNFWHGAYLGAELTPGHRERLCRELDQLKENGITNLRIMAASEASTLAASVTPAFQTSAGQYNEPLLAGLDFLLHEMGKRNMKAVLVLNNYWQWSGGMTQYLNWATGETIIDPDKTGDWSGYQNQSARFYAHGEANRLFRNYVKMLIERENTFSKRLYREDPVIMSWQLANEPRPAMDAASNATLANAIVEWVQDTASYIHSLDTNHLVSTGNEGMEGTRFSTEIYHRIHEGSHVDYMTFHIWPNNWGWFDAKKPEVTFDRAIQKTDAYFAEHIAVAAKLNKPTVLEEFGMERDGGHFSSDAGTTYRNRYLEHVVAAVLKSAKSGSPLAGLNFWAWGGEAKASHSDYVWRAGDDFMGDPPQEPQGLNAVFSTDTSTLQLFHKLLLFQKQSEKLR